MTNETFNLKTKFDVAHGRHNGNMNQLKKTCQSNIITSTINNSKYSFLQKPQERPINKLGKYMKMKFCNFAKF